MTITEIIWGLGVSFRRHALIILIVGALALVSGCANVADGESKMLNSYGTQVLDHQGNKPDKEYMKKHRPSHREYPTRLYRGITDEQGQVWLTCDIKGRYEGL